MKTLTLIFFLFFLFGCEFTHNLSRTTKTLLIGNRVAGEVVVTPQPDAILSVNTSDQSTDTVDKSTPVDHFITLLRLLNKNPSEIMAQQVIAEFEKVHLELGENNEDFRNEITRGFNHAESGNIFILNVYLSVIDRLLGENKKTLEIGIAKASLISLDILLDIYQNRLGNNCDHVKYFLLAPVKSDLLERRRKINNWMNERDSESAKTFGKLCVETIDLEIVKNKQIESK